MSRLLLWTATRINRRGFLRRATALTFGIFSGIAAGIPEVALASGCFTGSFPLCPSQFCSGSTCRSSGTTACRYTSCCCGNGRPCWTSGSHKCCDCLCTTASGKDFKCICHG
jgi:hypothetical protein